MLFDMLYRVAVTSSSLFFPKCNRKLMYDRLKVKSSLERPDFPAQIKTDCLICYSTEGPAIASSKKQDVTYKVNMVGICLL